MQRWLSKLLMIVLGCGTAFLIAEVSIRIAAPRVLIEPLGIILDKQLIYRLPPKAHGAYGKQDREWYMHVSINSHGLRDREIPYARKKGSFRILGLGDSMTFAEGAEINEIYLKQLEKKLNINHPTEVINAAVRGWGPDQEVAFLELEGYRYHPDLTIIAFFPGNDFEDALYGGIFRLEGGIAVRQKINASISPKYNYYVHQHHIQSLPLYGWMMYHSHLANLLRQIYPRIVTRLFYARKNSHKDDFMRLNQSEEEHSWRLVKAIYERLFHMQDKTGKVFVLMIPAYDKIKKGQSPRIKRMVELCKKWHVPYLNLLPDFHTYIRQGGNLDHIYFPHDKHMTPTGHSFVAKRLNVAMKQAGIIPE